MPITRSLLTLLALTLCCLGAAESASPTPALVLSLDHVGRSSAGALNQARNQAREAGLSTIVLDLRGSSADADSAIALTEAALSDDDIQTVAYVSGTMGGGATAFALACDAVYLGPKGLLGAIGTPEDAATASLLTAKLRQIAITRSRPEDALLALALGENPQSFLAHEAKQRKLINGTHGSLDELLSALALSRHQEPEQAPAATDTGAVAAAAPSTATKLQAGTAAWIEIEGTIDPVQLAYLKRAFAAADEAGVSVIITSIKSPGGYLQSAIEMLELTLSYQGPDHPKLVAYVENEAISAAAALAYSHHEIYLKNTAKIGDIGVIFQTSEGIEYAPEKIETFMRVQLRTLADVRGWDRALLSKMTARNQILYEIHHYDGRLEYVIGDDLPSFRKRNPGIDDSQVVESSGEDRLLTLTAKEAVDMGMASGLVADREAMLAHLGIDSTKVIDLSPSATEELAWALGAWAPLLAAATVLFIVFELKTPGVGIWAILAGISGTAFLVCQYYLEMASHFEAVLLIIGAILIAVELFTMATSGLLAIGGAIIMVMGLFFAFMPNGVQFEFADERWAPAIENALLQALLSLGIAALGVIMLASRLHNSRLMKRLAVTAEISGDSGGVMEHDASLIGQRGIVSSPLHPGGTVIVAGNEVSARSEHGEALENGRAVIVIRAQFGELVVRPCRPEDEA
ncbi:MAG: hypothetical protein PF961_18915 [Planctomycetota bacterium]|nr:hypothetical protein [Planctomycetota bacterium]